MKTSPLSNSKCRLNHTKFIGLPVPRQVLNAHLSSVDSFVILPGIEYHPARAIKLQDRVVSCHGSGRPASELKRRVVRDRLCPYRHDVHGHAYFMLEILK